VLSLELAFTEFLANYCRDKPKKYVCLRAKLKCIEEFFCFDSTIWESRLEKALDGSWK
jgi:hypothetical protein